MTVSTTTNQWPHTGDGITEEFSFNNVIFAATDLKVYADTVLQTTGYTVPTSGINNKDGGNVVFTVAPAAGIAILIVRDVPNTQLTKYNELDAFPAKSHERGLDRGVVLIQQMVYKMARKIGLGASDPDDTIGDLPVAASRANKVFGFDANGDPMVSTEDMADIEGAATHTAAAQAAQTAAEAAQTTAASDAAAAAASAALAQAAAGSGPYQTVTILTTGTYDLEIADSRTYYVLDVSGGAVTVNLPAIGSDEGTTFGFEQTGTGNAATIVRDGTDQINGAAADYVLSADTEVVQFIADDNTPDNWIANIHSQTIAGDGLSKSGSTLALDRTAPGTWLGAQRSTALVDNDGSFDLSAKNNFKWTPTAADVIEFSGESSAIDQTGTIFLDNSSGHAITKGAEVGCDSDFLSTVSTAGKYLIGYYCDGTNVYVAYSGALTV